MRLLHNIENIRQSLRIHKALMRGEEVESFEVHSWVYDEKPIIVEVSAVVLPHERILLAFKDVTQIKYLQQQSKLASMGEMIGAIAHQWRQPLNELSIRIQKLKYAFQDERVDEEYIQHFIKKNKQSIDYMSKTIDDFRDFYREEKSKQLFSVQQALDDVASIMQTQLRLYSIDLVIQGEDFRVLGHVNEFKQAVINIINNAKDALVCDKIINRSIAIRMEGKKVLIRDNALGIPEKVLARVFEPYFTTKEKGTGIGLYLSKIIIEESMGAELSVHNATEGALFTINFENI